jgi:hypothetical protein
VFGLSVVTKTTPPLYRKRLSMYALLRERVYNCHPDNDTGNLVTEPLSNNGRPLRFRYNPAFRRYAIVSLRTEKIKIYTIIMNTISIF